LQASPQEEDIGPLLAFAKSATKTREGKLFGCRDTEKAAGIQLRVEAFNVFIQ